MNKLQYQYSIELQRVLLFYKIKCQVAIMFHEFCLPNCCPIFDTELTKYADVP